MYLRRVFGIFHQVGIENLDEKDRIYCATLQSLLADLNTKRNGLKAKYKLQQQRFDTVAKTGRDNIRSLALVSGTMLESLDGMLTQRERLMKCIERCRKRERLDEKVDPFMRRWGLQELAMMGQGDESEETGSVFAGVASSTEFGEGFNFTPKKMEHLITCDCNPCTCAMNEDVISEPMFSTIKSVQDFALLERFWTRFNRASLEVRVLRRRRTSMLHDNQQLKLALRNYMGGLNPLQHSVQTYSDELMVIPSSPNPLSPSSFVLASSDSDYASDESAAHPQFPTTPKLHLPSILKDTKFSSESQKGVRFPKQASASSGFQGRNIGEKGKFSVPIIDGTQVIRMLDRFKKF
ncbi:uncharacterized protein LOC118434716 isoform X1 [Folsomia candida]|uniref:uncharacterized protein LOC118434716 isoform X1 n=1 Tax=Folsomia candida TaxID=158441 RepID=UPI001605036A|nr:uncharacterized protein LOC118434716 isoform X1 [Folsomia candida]